MIKNEKSDSVNKLSESEFSEFKNYQNLEPADEKAPEF